jgi:hypothetical protein
MRRLGAFPANECRDVVLILRLDVSATLLIARNFLPHIAHPVDQHDVIRKASQ